MSRSVTTLSATPLRWRPVTVTGVGAPALGGLCWAVVAWEARRARRGPRPYERAHAGDALIGPVGGFPVRIAWLGDSLAAGLGADAVDDTPAHLVARMLERTVDVTVLAEPGSLTAEVLEQQVPRLDPDVDLVVVCVGANDVASPTSRARYAADLHELLAAVAPTPTVLLSLPDMGLADRLAQPLRTLAGWRARWFDAARARVAACHAHVASVDIASRPPGMSRRAARTMLCADRFHPGAIGYRMWAERIATACDHLLDATPTRAEVGRQRLVASCN